MKVERREEHVRIHVDDMDDLWYLKNILSTDDLVTMTAMRRAEKQDDMTRSKESKRVPVTVTIKIESLEFQEFSNRLKLLGVITGGSEDIIGEHQSFIVSEGDDLSLAKARWSQVQRNLLKEAEKRSEKIMGVFITLDEESADVVVMRTYGLQSMGRVYSGRTGKMYETSYSEKNYFAEISDILKKSASEQNLISVLGPGFTREHIVKYLSEDPYYAGKNLKSAPTGRSDMGAVYEYLQSDEAKKSFSEARLNTENDLFGRFLKELNSGGLFAYGADEVRKALEFGAVETLMISESKMPDPLTDTFSEMAKKSSSEVYVFSDISEPGKMLKSFGGYCAILRYRI